MKASAISLYLDEDVSVKIASHLRNRGFDVRTTVEAKNLGAADEEQLTYACKTKRVLVTHNIKHFVELHSRCISLKKSHWGIILAVRQNDSYETVLKLLHFLQETSSEEIVNQARYL